MKFLKIMGSVRIFFWEPKYWDCEFYASLASKVKAFWMGFSSTTLNGVLRVIVEVEGNFGAVT